MLFPRMKQKRCCTENTNQANGFGPMMAALDPLNVRSGSSTDLAAPKFDFRSSPESGLRSDIEPCPFGADFVAEVG